jgi:hypothetical protein
VEVPSRYALLVALLLWVHDEQLAMLVLPAQGSLLEPLD